MSIFSYLISHLGGNASQVHVRVHCNWHPSLSNTYVVYVEIWARRRDKPKDVGIYFTYALKYADLTVCIEDISDGWTVKPKRLIVEERVFFEKYTRYFLLKAKKVSSTPPRGKIWLQQNGVKIEPCVLFPQHGTFQENIPREIIARGELAISSYEHEIKSGRTKMINSRIMVLGKEGVGKTSLVKAMLGERFNPKEPSTDGIVTLTFFQTDDKDYKWKEINIEASELMQEKHERILAEKIAKRIKEPQDSSVSSDEEMASTSTAEFEDLKSKTSVDKELPILLDKLKKPDVDSKSEDEILQKIPKGVLKKLFEILKKSNTTPTDLTSVMDFAGQLVYYISHRLFLNNGSVYLLVFSLVEKLNDLAHPRDCKSKLFEMTNLQMIVFLIRSIYEYAILPYSLGKNKMIDGNIAAPPIILVGTHKDKMIGTEEDKEKEIEAMCEQILSEIEDMPYERHVACKIHAVDNTNNLDEGIKILKSMAVGYMKEMSRVIPISWVDFQARILKDKTKLTMSKDEIKKIATDCGIKSGIETTLNYLTDIGITLFSNTNEKLMNTVIVNMPMMIVMLRRIITAVKPKLSPNLRKSWRAFDSEGILDKQLLDHLWKNEVEENHDICLEVMKLFNLLFEDQDEEGNRVFLVPSQMKATTDSLEVKKDDKQSISIYVTPKDFLPDSVYNVLIVCLLNEMKRKGRSTKSKYVELFHNCSNFDLYDDHSVSLGAVQIGNRRAFKLEISHLPGSNGIKKTCKPKPSVCMEVLNILEEKLTAYGTKKGVGYDLHVHCNECQPEAITDLHKLGDCLSRCKIRCGNKSVKTTHFKCLFPDFVPSVRKRTPVKKECKGPSKSKRATTTTDFEEGPSTSKQARMADRPTGGPSTSKRARMTDFEEGPSTSKHNQSKQEWQDHQHQKKQE